jgi:hypothetical protein
MNNKKEKYMNKKQIEDLLTKLLGDHGFKADKMLITNFKDGSQQVEQDGDWVVVRSGAIVDTIHGEVI